MRPTCIQDFPFIFFFWIRETFVVVFLTWRKKYISMYSRFARFSCETANLPEYKDARREKNLDKIKKWTERGNTDNLCRLWFFFAFFFFYCSVGVAFANIFVSHGVFCLPFACADPIYNDVRSELKHKSKTHKNWMFHQHHSSKDERKYNLCLFCPWIFFSALFYREWKKARERKKKEREMRIQCTLALTNTKPTQYDYYCYDNVSRDANEKSGCSSSRERSYVCGLIQYPVDCYHIISFSLYTVAMHGPHEEM